MVSGAFPLFVEIFFPVLYTKPAYDNSSTGDSPSNLIVVQ